ncbi:MAG: putative pyridoxine 5'-phosphate oxidase superfamily flavin-nucleotide-binding protein [Methylophagaceae bacterium]
MGKLNNAVKKAIKQTALFPLATASSSGYPNVVPVMFVQIENDDELWMIDNFMDKTLKNLEQNPTAALNVLIPEQNISYQIKGTIRIETSGEQYQKMRAIVLAAKPSAPAKGLIVMQVTEVFDCWPGTTMGHRLDKGA